VPLEELGRKGTEEPDETHLFFFAGVQFIIEAPEAWGELLVEQGAKLPCAVPGLVCDDPLRRRTGDMRCELALRHELPRPSASDADDVASRALSWTWLDDSCRLVTSSAWAELTWGGRTEFTPGLSEREWDLRARGRAALAPCAGALEALLSGVAAAILYRRGGAVLHPAAVEADGGVVAFIGPSGAGKSTAAKQSGRAAFCVDRLALIPPQEAALGWSACALPGGSVDPQDPYVNQLEDRPLILPLRGVLRVRQEPGGAAIEPVRGVKALGLLRAAVFQGPRLPEQEARLLESLESLLTSVPLGELRFGLGDPLQREIERWLAAAEAK
jgi:hypothetical protein